MCMCVVTAYVSVYGRMRIFVHVCVYVNVNVNASVHA